LSGSTARVTRSPTSHRGSSVLVVVCSRLSALSRIPCPVFRIKNCSISMHLVLYFTSFTSLAPRFVLTFARFGHALLMLRDVTSLVSFTLASSASTSMVPSFSDEEDGTFDLYDLRVEVVCPPGARILCGASPGDYFTLQGEMLYLPPGQGFSIYSIGTWSLPMRLRNSAPKRDATCRGRSTPPRRETTQDRPRRLDDHGCRGCLP
jgi:hypothetical protein